MLAPLPVSRATTVSRYARSYAHVRDAHPVRHVAQPAAPVWLRPAALWVYAAVVLLALASGFVGWLLNWLAIIFVVTSFLFMTLTIDFLIGL